MPLYASTIVAAGSWREWLLKAKLARFDNPSNVAFTWLNVTSLNTMHRDCPEPRGPLTNTSWRYSGAADGECASSVVQINVSSRSNEKSHFVCDRLAAAHESVTFHHFGDVLEERRTRARADIRCGGRVLDSLFSCVGRTPS